MAVGTSLLKLAAVGIAIAALAALVVGIGGSGATARPPGVPESTVPTQQASPRGAAETAGGPASIAQTGWARTGPGAGGAFSSIGAGPTGILMASSDLSGAYRSLDRGMSWDNVGVVDGLTTTHVSGVGFDLLDPSVILLSTDAGIFRSEDGGETVKHVLANGYVTVVALGAQDSAIGYAAYHSDWNTADGVVYKTTDNGRSWSQVSDALPDGLRILKLLVSPDDGDLVYLLSGKGRFASGPRALYRSGDGGKSWHRLAPGSGRVMDVAFDLTDSRVMYASTFPGASRSGKLFVSSDGGDSWHRLARRTGIIWPGTNGALRLIDVRHQLPWDDRDGVWESRDGGETWTQLSRSADWDRGWSDAPWAYEESFSGVARTLGLDPSDPDALFWATGQFVFGTFDGGRSFHELFTDEVVPGGWRSRGLDNVVPAALVVSPADGRHIYAGFFDLGCWHSPDGGQSWHDCNAAAYTGEWQGNGGNTMALAADPERVAVVWAGMAEDWEKENTLLKSSDHGHTWSEANEGLPGTVLAGLTVDPGSPPGARELWVTAGGDVYVGQDDGASWEMRLDCDGCRATAVVAGQSSTVFAGGEAGLWRSLEGGVEGSWHEVGPPEMRGDAGDDFLDKHWSGITAIRTDPGRPGRLYVVVYGPGRGLYRSDDLGETWHLLWRHDFLRDVAISPDDSDVLTASASSTFSSGGYEAGRNGIWRSIDGGRTWSSANEGLDWPLAGPLALDPADPAHVWTGLLGLGLAHRRFSP